MSEQKHKKRMTGRIYITPVALQYRAGAVNLCRYSAQQHIHADAVRELIERFYQVKEWISSKAATLLE